MLTEAGFTFSSVEHSVQGKAGALWGKDVMPEAGNRYLPLSICSSRPFLPFLVMNPPGGGRRVRYGELRSPSCTPAISPLGGVTMFTGKSPMNTPPRYQLATARASGG